MLLYIRADGNKIIGIGHIMRCLSIAKAAKANRLKTIFIVADNNCMSLITHNGFEAICLNSQWDHLDEELDALAELISEKNIKHLLVDSYSVTEKYFKTIHQRTKVIYIDDLNAFHYDCDILINYNYYWHIFDYQKHYSDTRLLMGPQYAPLREEFNNPPKRNTISSIRSVLVLTGGNDPYNFAGEFVNDVIKNKNFSSLEFHIVCGKFNPHTDKLLQHSESHKNIMIHIKVQSMYSLMQKCDIAVSAAGSTLYELCACGLPSIIFTYADNQTYGAESFGEKLMWYAGDFRNNRSDCLDKVNRGIHFYKENLKYCQKISLEMQELVDGTGAKRIISEVINANEG